MSATKSNTSKRRIIVIDIAVGLATLVLIAAGLWLSTSRQSDQQAITCPGPGTRHQVELIGDNFKPAKLDVRRCDQLLIANKGTQSYELAFGSHDNLTGYPGFSQQFLRPGEYFILDALQSGNYMLHDHTGNKAYLQLTIND